MDPLLPEIDAFMARYGLSEWAFGEMVLNDRHLVRQLRAGRELRRATRERIRVRMASYKPAPPPPFRNRTRRTVERHQDKAQAA
jgi:hypothetical protein